MTCDMTYRRNLKHSTHELLYKSETDSQTQRTDLGLVAKEDGVGERWSGRLGSADVSRYTQNG